MTGSAAAAAGLRAGDAVIAVDGQPYAAWYLGSRRLGQAYGFDLQRDGQPRNVRVTMGSLLQANRPGTLSAVLVALVFWGTGMLLLRWGWRQVHVDLLVLLFQACGAAVLPGLAYPRFLLPRPWLVAAGVSGVIMAAPLLLHYHLSFPVVLGRGRRRSLGLAVLYLLAAAGVADAALRAVPWRSPALVGASLVGMLAIGVAVFVYFRRASADGRRRLRVVVAGTALGILPPLVAYLLPTVVAGYTPAIPRWLVSLCVAIVPLSYLYASVRHNLFGIDRLLNRTLVYGILASAVFMLGLGLLLLADRLAPSNRLLHAAVVAVLALLVAMAFTWARTQVQRLVDRLFYGGWYDYPAVVEHASTALAGCQQWEDVARILTDEVPAQMQLSGAQLCVGERSTPPLAQGPAPRLELPLRCGQQALRRVDRRTAARRRTFHIRRPAHLADVGPRGRDRAEQRPAARALRGQLDEDPGQPRDARPAPARIPALARRGARQAGARSARRTDPGARRAEPAVWPAHIEYGPGRNGCARRPGCPGNAR